MFRFIKYYSKTLSLFKKYLGNSIFIIYLLVFISSMFESFGIALIIPFISQLSGDNIASNNSWVNIAIFKVINFLGIPNSLSSILFLILLSFILKGIILFLSLALSAYLRGRLLNNLKIAAFESINKIKYIKFIEEDTGNIMNIVNEQTNRTLEALKFFIQTGSQIIIVFVYILTSALISFNFFLLSLFTGMIITLIFKNANEYIRIQSRNISLENGNLSKFLIQSIQSLKYLRSTNQQEYTQTRVKRSTSKLVNYQKKVAYCQAFVVAIKEPISILFLTIILFTQLILRQKEVTSILVTLLLFYRATKWDIEYSRMVG